MNGYTPKTYLPNYTNDFRECSNEDGDLVGIDPGKMGTYVICLALLVDRPTGVRPTCIMVDPSSAHCRSRWHPNWALRFHTTTMMSLSYTIVYWYILHKYMYNIYIYMYTYVYVYVYSMVFPAMFPTVSSLSQDLPSAKDSATSAQTTSDVLQLFACTSCWASCRSSEASKDEFGGRNSGFGPGFLADFCVFVVKCGSNIDFWGVTSFLFHIWTHMLSTFWVVKYNAKFGR